MFDIIAEHLVYISLANDTKKYNINLPQLSDEELKSYTGSNCSLVEIRHQGTLCGAIWIFSHVDYNHLFVQGIFATIPYFYLKLVTTERQREISLPSISNLLINNVVELGRDNEFSEIRLHPLDNMYSILTKKYGFVDYKDNSVVFGIIDTLTPHQVHLLLE